VKAMSVEPCSGVSSSGPFGVWGATRDHSSVWNRRDPSAWPLSGEDRRYKPMVKSCGGQRESDGVVVPVIGVSSAPGGKGPDFDQAGGGGKRKGMAGTARSNYPDGQSRPVDNVRRLQRKLWAAAKQSSDRRFHALFDRVHRGDVLWEAWKRVLANRGAAGVDRLSLEQVQVYGVERMLDELARDLRDGRY
jgi:RNA-directed DNA polymerase